eukprot:7524134-Karenia_brevis.AAC.1
MQREIGEPVPGSVLADEAAQAGRRTHRMQAALTRARERHAFQELDVSIRELPPTDVRRAAWLNVNRYSASWVTAWPCTDLWLTDAEFVEVTTRYLGLPSPACAALVGQPIGKTRQ